LDVELGLTGDGFSMLIQSLATRIATKMSYAQAVAALTMFLHWSPAQDNIESMVLGLGKHMGAWFEAAPAPEGNGEVLVIQIDSKATPTEAELEKRRGKRVPNPHPGSQRHRGRAARQQRGSKKRRKKGDKAKNGKMATIGVLYTLRRSADEIKVKAQRELLDGPAMMVATHLWPGSVVSTTRDLDLITALVAQVCRMSLYRLVLIAVDGLASYVTAFERAFRIPVRRFAGAKGRPRLDVWPHLTLVQVVKPRHGKTLQIERRVVRGTLATVQRLVHGGQGMGGINTAFIERLNATFRQRCAHLARRTRHLAHTAAPLTASMYLIGCLYNFCDPHQCLRRKLWSNGRCYHWVQRPTALAVGLTDHI